jgi:hypothetical protein
MSKENIVVIVHEAQMSCTCSLGWIERQGWVPFIVVWLNSANAATSVSFSLANDAYQAPSSSSPSLLQLLVAWGVNSETFPQSLRFSSSCSSCTPWRKQNQGSHLLQNFWRFLSHVYLCLVVRPRRIFVSPRYAWCAGSHFIICQDKMLWNLW